MKKTILAVILAIACVACLAACGGNQPAPAPAPETQSQAPEVAIPVMSYAEYIAADDQSAVCVETYVQDKQGWWEKDGVGVATLYTEDENGGAYFIYEMPMSEADFEKLVPGTKIKVYGYKSTWDGETEIADATFEIEDGSYIAEAFDVTDLLGTDELIDHMNQYVSFNDMTIAPSKDKDGNDAAFLYKWDGSGQQGDDLYFNATDAKGNTHTFTVESYLRGKDTEVYKTVEGLKIGDKCDMEGFLYWYTDNANPHITKVVVK